MSWFRNRTLMTKLLLGFAIVCVLVAASGGIAYRGLASSREGMRVLYADYTVAGTDLAKSAVNLARFRNNVVAATGARDEARLNQALAPQPSIREAVTSGLDAYAATVLRVSRSGRDERKDLEKVRAAVREYFAAAEETIHATRALVRAGTDAERAECRREVDRRVQQAGLKFDAVTASIDELVKTVTEVASDVNSTGNDSAQAAQSTLVGGTVGAAALSMLIGLGLARMITGPLGRTVETLESVARGDLGVAVEVASGDEVGRLGAAVNATVGGIRTALGQTRVDWPQIGKQRERNDDYVGQLLAVSRVQAVIEFGLDGTVLTANENFLSTMGYRLDEIRGQHHRMFVAPSHATAPEYREFWAKLGRGEFVSNDFKRVRKGGKEVWLRAAYNPILDSVTGKPYKVVEFASDVTAEKSMEECARSESIELQRKVGEIRTCVTALAAGDFTVSIPDLGSDDVGQMSAELNQAVRSMRAALEGVREVAEQLADASSQLSSASEEISSGAQEQASSLEETASSLQEITATVKQSADNAQQARQLASGSKEVAERGGAVVSGAVEAMSEINASSKKIADIITTIDEIAFQTNLLALNAAVEAARAGEQGRGFAVVATEVRNLAQRSATAAKEIKGLINDSVKKVEAGTELVNKSGDTLAEIVTSVKRVTDIVTEMAAASKEQSSGIEQVNKAVSQMDSVTQRNASQTEEMSATAQALTDQAGQLRDLVSRFKLRHGNAAPAVRAAGPKPRPAVAKALKRSTNGNGGGDGFSAF
ncbi:Methyl-accepting chemotaxis protein II [Gemmata obscuriglobus]|uniref:HAMP domain-containing protein n=1 Tax=Gemmata obscuriglobus TaxID=114 RepID=A0A2Z3GRI9_9BACT|nr:methyl-accepting chemotaxis protein [Gemmata obscuriglobus]AWM36393.1 HAMP domain-containing protein [Gemmata obscuriglobus]QEG30993.1 Methyl-accepting chemotaxis protein II [Gemmata obscuriglobus]VTS10328.1 chemotaxis partial : Globin-coupled methyl-accepting chemotaxis protein (Modular protein) OS=Candidatus Nitrospira defluvii GN=cheM PE=3 SV=1: 4HB_MCP_1: HAMP: PAS_9: MCPsignal [Gemmata obscuriglobus UQM 2246]